ncbi:hypothetical protein BIFGAL_03975 [Bifidobacterium gallicum DSM 20093 = LMG 11596]|uniref:Uncharacterized protein n=1 Tax=Bifidobacterium gallicum DSM 20093 = LMG 11596 TaxID=561180 RepID=D1NVT2_9BIFI|nr:hypothetical protein BIFGAL_03975 [Bifidobacterium gallicum DSM 20093 = LMG 11596]
MRRFADVNENTPHARRIWWLAATGIIGGETVRCRRIIVPVGAVMSKSTLRKMLTMWMLCEKCITFSGECLRRWHNG